jgi:hypothetical protein
VDTCPRCGYKEGSASQQAFELFHALRDEYAAAQGLNKVEAKDTLCILFGVSIEDEGQLDIPRDWIACALWGRRYLRKSTTLYTKDEMNKLITASQEAIHARSMS